MTPPVARTLAPMTRRGVEMRLSAIEALRQLPPVFTSRDAMRVFDVKPTYIKLLMHRWKERELVRPAGPRLGVFYNLIVAPDWQAHQSEAIRIAHPSAVVLGASVLHQHGWITQIPRQVQIAVLEAPTVAQMDGVELHRRPLAWYRDMAPWGEPVLGLPALTPQKALSDCMAHRDTMWCPDPDDLDLPEEGGWEPVSDSPGER
jgi:hypothetical protein